MPFLPRFFSVKIGVPRESQRLLSIRQRTSSIFYDLSTKVATDRTLIKYHHGYLVGRSEWRNRFNLVAIPRLADASIDVSEMVSDDILRELL